MVRPVQDEGLVEERALVQGPALVEEQGPELVVPFGIIRTVQSCVPPDLA